MVKHVHCKVNLFTSKLKSAKGNVRMKVSAYTTTRVTGYMRVVDWNSYKRQWPHLRNINFPISETRPMVDILIGLDCADLHCALQEVRGRAGKPVARLTPLGWTCVGKPGSNSDQVLLLYQENIGNRTTE